MNRTSPTYDTVQVAGLLGVTPEHTSRLCKLHQIGYLERRKYRLVETDINELVQIIKRGNPSGKKGRPHHR